MGRIKAPFHSIFQTKTLIDLYLAFLNLPSYPDDISEAAYKEALLKNLETDGVIKGQSKNTLDKVLGEPYQKTPEESEGIDTGILEKIAEIVLKKLPEHYTREKFLPNEYEFAWPTFKEYIAPEPKALSYLNSKRYYKFLDSKEQDLVDGYSRRIVNEIVIPTAVEFYAVEFMENRNTVKSMQLQIDRKANRAYLTTYKEENDRVKLAELYRSDITGGIFTTNSRHTTIVLLNDNDAYTQIILNLPFSNADAIKLKWLLGIFTFTSSQPDYITGRCCLHHYDIPFMRLNPVKSNYGYVDRDQAPRETMLDLELGQEQTNYLYYNECIYNHLHSSWLKFKECPGNYFYVMREDNLLTVGNAEIKSSKDLYLADTFVCKLLSPSHNANDNYLYGAFQERNFLSEKHVMSLTLFIDITMREMTSKDSLVSKYLIGCINGFEITGGIFATKFILLRDDKENTELDFFRNLADSDNKIDLNKDSLSEIEIKIKEILTAN